MRRPARLVATLALLVTAACLPSGAQRASEKVADPGSEAGAGGVGAGAVAGEAGGGAGAGAGAGGAGAGAGAGGRAMRQGNFTSVCQYSHSAPDDPIVHPGHTGAAHLHDFFANTSTGAGSTVESLRGAVSKCERRGDTAAYWVPTLSDGGAAVHPGRVTVYYQAAGRDSLSIKPFPPGLRMVTEAGRGVGWACAGPAGPTPESPTVPECPAKTHLVLRVLFPDCWDGKTLDSADHRSHMADAVAGACPAGHPVPVPRLRLVVQYPPRVGGPDVTLSSGAPGTAHADFFNAWDAEAQGRLVKECINRSVVCGPLTPA